VARVDKSYEVRNNKLEARGKIQQEARGKDCNGKGD